MIKNILVTGAAGFVGKRLIEKLIKKEYVVHPFSSSDGDISNCSLNFPGIDHVFHLAAKTFVPDSWKDPMDFYKVNLMGTTNMLEFCRVNQCSLTFLSTYVYGKPLAEKVSEDHPKNPNSPYNHSKLLAEDLCKFYADKFNVPVTILRPFNIYGPGQKSNFLLPTIIEQCINPAKKNIEVMDLNPRRDYLFIDDLIEAMIISMRINQFTIYNVGTGSSFSVEEIIKYVLNATGINKKYSSRQLERVNEITDIVADISKIRRELHWEPKYSLLDGITATINREITGGDGKNEKN